MTDAAQWYAELIHGLSPERCQEFKAWFEDREHRLEFVRVRRFTVGDPHILPALEPGDVTRVPTDPWEVATYCENSGRVGVGFLGPNGEVRHLLVFEDERALRCLHRVLNDYLLC